MKKTNEFKFLAFILLAIFLSGCAPASVVPTNTAPPPTFTPSPTNEDQPIENEVQRLVTVEEVAALSVDVGVENWKLDQEEIGKARVCRYFFGQSWSASPNNATNCIWKSGPDVTFTEVVQWLKDNKVTDPSATTLESSYDYGSDFALFAYMGSNGQSVYDAFLLKDNLLYLASITLGTPVGYSPEKLFSENSNVIDAFLHDVLMNNLAKGK